MASGSALLAPGDFFTGFRARLKKSLPPDLREFKSGRGRGRLMKVHYGVPEFHYEVWHHTGAGRLEIGLHFEASAEENARALDFFRTRMVEIKATLRKAELEPWDRGWCRLYETLPAARLDESVLEAGAGVMRAYIVVLQPVLRNFMSG